MCSPEKRAHRQESTQACTPHPFWSLRATRNCAIQFNPDRNHLWKWIGINPDRIQIGRMRIQCGRAQTGFDLVQCALGAQCGRAFRSQGVQNRQPTVEPYRLTVLRDYWHCCICSYCHSSGSPPVFLECIIIIICVCYCHLIHCICIVVRMYICTTNHSCAYKLFWYF